MFEQHFTNFTVNLNDNNTINSGRDIKFSPNFYPELPYLYRAMLYRNEINMNTFLLIVGNPRTSKSYLAMKTAEVYSEKLGKEFDVEKQLTFDDVKKFLIWSQDANNSIFILDETGTALSGDMFWTLQNRIMRRFVQTQGFRKNVLIWVLPSIVFIQKGFRFMVNYACKTIRQGNADIYKVVVDQLKGKGYPDFIENLSYSKIDPRTEKIYIDMKKEWNDKELVNDIGFLHQLENPKEYTIKNGILL